ncbi:MAG: RNA 2',3'-cyclic phosphodiesterase [Gammaproteobacteria bacterium]
MKKHRLFFALWPDDATRNTLEEFCGNAIADCGGNHVKPENFHITLRFLGQVNFTSNRCLRKAAARAHGEPVKLMLDRLGFWSGPQVLWLGANKVPDTLLRLAVNINTELGECGFKPEDRPFRPHVTLARQVTKPPESPSISPLEWTATHFVMVESDTRPEGVRYKVLEKWPLTER